MARNPHSRSRDMVLSMAVILVPVLLVIALFTRPADPAEVRQRVDVDGNYARAAEESPYPVLRAEGLSQDWLPIRVGWAKTGDVWLDNEPATSNWWLVGYLSPDEIYFGVQQRDGVVPGFLGRVTRDGSPLGEPVMIGEHTWTRYESDDGRTRSLVSVTDDLTTIVSADTDFAAIEDFAAHLASN